MNIISILKTTFSEFSEDKASRLAAALSYYTIFALAPLLVIAVFVAGLFFSTQRANEELFSNIARVAGQGAAESLMNWSANAAVETGGVFATAAGIIALLIGATGAFIHLQQSLNTIWDVEPKKSSIGEMIKARLLSFLMVLVIGLLLVAAMFASTAVSFIQGFFPNGLPGGDFIWYAGEFIVTFAIITVLFALIFKVLPDVELPWRQVWIGALFTALLFNLGILLIGLYLGYASVGSTYGAAGSLVVILLWIYYSATIFFFGAEFTQVYARRTNAGVEPARGAHWTGEGEGQVRSGGVIWKPGMVSRPIPSTGSVGAAANVEPPRGFFALMAIGILTLTGGLLALLRMKPARRK